MAATQEAPPSWRDIQEQYLVSQGWERQGENSRGEPLFIEKCKIEEAKQKPVLKDAVVLPSKEGPVQVKQTHGPAIPWALPMTEAYRVAKANEEAKKEEAKKKK